MYVALAPFLKSCPDVVTLGVRPSFACYSEGERRLLLQAFRVFFPTPRFAPIFKALEKPTFPNATTYRYQRSRILQKLLFQYLGLPHPRTRIYYGNRQKSRILDDFQAPFDLLGPTMAPGSAGSSHRVHSPDELGRLVGLHTPILVRETIEWEERIRFLCVLCNVVGSQRRARFSENDDEGRFVPIPMDDPLIGPPLGMTRRLLNRASLDDIVIEWGYGNGSWQVLEMARPPMRWAVPGGILDRHGFLCRSILSGAFERIGMPAP